MYQRLDCGALDTSVDLQKNYKTQKADTLLVQGVTSDYSGLRGAATRRH